MPLTDKTREPGHPPSYIQRPMPAFPGRCRHSGVLRQQAFEAYEPLERHIETADGGLQLRLEAAVDFAKTVAGGGAPRCAGLLGGARETRLSRGRPFWGD